MSKQNFRPQFIVVTELFYPEESATAHIMSKIASHLASRQRVLVITGPESYEGVSQRVVDAGLAHADQIEIVRVRVPALDKNRLAQRALRFVLLSLKLAWLTWRRARCGDRVFSVTNPAPLIVLLALVRRLRGFTLTLLVHDVFPENAVATGIIKTPNSLLARLATWVFNRAYAAADRLIVIGRDMRDVVAGKVAVSRRPPRIDIIENWADLEAVTPIARDASLLSAWGQADKVVVQYAGNIGRAQGILPIARLVDSVQNPDLHCMFIGSGAVKHELDAYIGEHPAQLSARPAYTRSEQQMILNSCDIALVVLSEGMYGLGVPSKTYNIMAAGKPILYLGPRDSEIYRLVQEHAIGWAFDWSAQPALVEFLAGLSVARRDEFAVMGRRARRLAEEAYGEEKALRRFEHVITGD